MTSLEALGWRAHESRQAESCPPHRLFARVVGEGKNLYRVVGADGDERLAEVSGRLRFEARGRLDFPAVGDWVEVEPRQGSDRLTLHRVLERRSCLARKGAGQSGEDQILATNVDTAFLVTSLNQDLNPRRIERYLTLIWDSGAMPVILLSKADLCEDADAVVAELELLAPGVPIHPISSLEGMGLESLGSYLVPGKTCVLLGSSGVGKSTLTNRLLGGEVLETQSIRESDDRGRHTTSARHLFRLASGGMLIDTPGMRELQLSDSADGLSAAFEEIERLVQACRFNDCGHRSEPGCAVQTALRQGQLAEERYEGYLKLQREARFQARRQDKAAQAEDRKRWKKIHAQARQHMKMKRGEPLD